MRNLIEKVHHGSAAITRKFGLMIVRKLFSGLSLLLGRPVPEEIARTVKVVVVDNGSAAGREKIVHARTSPFHAGRSTTELPGHLQAL